MDLIIQSVSGRNKYMCSSSCALCYGLVGLCAIYSFLPCMVEKSFVLVALTRLNVTEPEHWVTWSHRIGANFLLLKGKRIQYFTVSACAWPLLNNSEDKMNVIILYLYLDWYKHTDVTAAAFLHAYWNRSLRILYMRSLK